MIVEITTKVQQSVVEIVVNKQVQIIEVNPQKTSTTVEVAVARNKPGDTGPVGPQGIVGPQGLQGPTGDSTFIHSQVVSSSVWDIVHPLNKFPSVSVIDSGGTSFEGDLVYVSTSHVVIYFDAPFGGKAYLN